MLLAPAAVAAQALSRDEQQLVLRLQDPKPTVRRVAAERLGELRTRGAAPELVKAAKTDPEPAVRRAAVRALGRVRDEALIPEMLAILDDPDRSVRVAAIEGLAALYIDREEGFFTRVRETVVHVVPFWDERETLAVEPYDLVDERIPRAIGELMRRDRDRSVRVAAIRALGSLRARGEVDRLADAMASDAEVRPEVLDAFVRIGDTEAARYAIPLFEDENARVAAQAMIAAGRLRAGSAVIPLLNVFGDGEPDRGLVGKVKKGVTFAPDRRRAALQALALIGDPRAEKAFHGSVGDRDAGVRRAAYEGLARGADPRFLDLVSRNALMEKDAGVRLAQAFALYKMKRTDVYPRIVDGLRARATRDQAKEYLLETDAPAHLVPYLRTPDREVQRIVIDVLGHIGDEATIAELRPFVRGTRPETGEAAARAIRRIEWRTRGSVTVVEGTGERPRRVGEP